MPDKCNTARPCQWCQDARCVVGVGKGGSEAITISTAACWIHCVNLMHAGGSEIIPISTAADVEELLRMAVSDVTTRPVQAIKVGGYTGSTKCDG
jgi:hypothetical protein